MELEQIKNIFEAQSGFNSRVISDWDNLNNWNDEHRNLWLTRQLTAYAVELVELVDSTNWKWWKKYSQPEDIQNIHVELVDMLHFITSLYLISKKSPEEFYDDWEDFDSEVSFDSIHSLYVTSIISMGDAVKSGNDWSRALRTFKVLCQYYNLTDEDLYNKYYAKLSVNHERQNKGYSAETKDVNDCKHI